MANYWDTTACSVPLPYDAEEMQQRELLGLLALQIGCNHLTPDTLREWMVRVLLFSRLRNARPEFGSVDGLHAALRRWCGMVINCDHVDRGEWLERRLCGAVSCAEWDVDKAIENAAIFVPFGTVGSL